MERPEQMPDAVPRKPSPGSDDAVAAGCLKRPHVSHYTGYKIDRCRCAECAAAARARAATYRASPSGRAQIAESQSRNRKWRRGRIADIKRTRGCADCGWNGNPAALDFDHLGDKSFTIATNINLAWETIVAEIAKCDVVCANCHRLRTYRRANGMFIGTVDGRYIHP